MSTETEATMGEIAYNAYRDHTGGISLATGVQIPEWRFLPKDIKAAWEAAGGAAASQGRANAK